MAYGRLGLEDEVVFPPTPKAELGDLTRVHSLAYLTELEAFCAKGGGDIDPDTYARADSWNAARVQRGRGWRRLPPWRSGVKVWPSCRCALPGTTPNVTGLMGFCLLNNVAVAAASLTARGQKVLIVDWDVHHGNGTQSIFWDDPDVLYVSTHQYPFFPGTGRAREIGGPKAPGLTVNIPLPAGATGDVVRAAIDTCGTTDDRRVLSRLGAGVVWISTRTRRIHWVIWPCPAETSLSWPGS